MATVKDTLDWMYESTEPQICLWCRHCGLVVTSEVWGAVCLKYENGQWYGRRRRGSMAPFPPNWEQRPFLPLVSEDERRECWEPTRVSDERMRTLDNLGIT